MSELTVETLIHRFPELALKVVAGRLGVRRKIPLLVGQRPSLVLLGRAQVDGERILVLGLGELKRLGSMEAGELHRVLELLLTEVVPCVIVAGNHEVPPSLLEEADRRGVPLLRTRVGSDALLRVLSPPQREGGQLTGTLHGVLVDVCGVGVLIKGRSGVGKSEAALDLLLRGHRLVADDVVDVEIGPDGQVWGTCSELIKNHMEIRGLGILNVRDLFGVTAVIDRKPVELIIELVDWDQRREYDRVGLDDRFLHVLQIKIPLLQVPVSPGRGVTTIIEVAARNLLLKRQGVHSARAFQNRLTFTMGAERMLGGLDESEEGSP